MGLFASRRAGQWGRFGGKLVSGEWQTRTLSEGTDFETTAFRFDAGPGATAVVLGGQHGNEPSGKAAAERVLDYEPQQGTLVVFPDADPTSTAAGSYSGGILPTDMNSLWYNPPRHDPVIELWETIREVDPDYVLDLHSSGGVYGGSPSGVGQAIFPTSGVRGVVDQVCDYITTEVMSSSYGRDLAYRRGNTLSGVPPNSLIRLCSVHGIEGAICEPTKAHGTSLQERTEWNFESSRKFLELVGMRIE